ncbi:SpoIIE family protein phosphatase [candidate division GN15 bacterium]|nr:SpoIIE family protein phosphatase [candidate division GN15 bacterium]
MNAELIQTLLYFVAGGFLIFLAITVIRDNFGNRLNRATGGILLFGGLGPLAVAVSSVMEQPTAGGAALYNLYHAWELLFPSLLVFSWYFPVDRLREFKHPRLRYLVFAPQLIHLILALFFSDIDSLLELLSASEAQGGFSGALMRPFAYVLQLLLLLIGFILTNEVVIFGSINVLYVVSALYFLESGRRLQTNPRLMPQIEAILWAIRLGMGLYVVGLIGRIMLEEVVTEDVQSVIYLLAALIGAIFFVSAIVRHQFLDVRLIFRQSLIYTIASAVLVGLYIVIGVQAIGILEPMFGERAEIVSYIVIILLLLFFQPISNWIDGTIRSMFMRTRSDHRNIIERFSREIISVFDPHELRRKIEDTMKTAMLVEKVYFVLYDDEIGEYAILKSDDYGRRTVIRRDDMMLRGINLLDRPTPFHTLLDYREGSRLAEVLTELRVKLILPMKDTEHLLGFLALTSKVAGYRYTPEDYNLLGVLSNQMVSALTNARLYADSLERIRLQEEVTMARQIQLDLLPSKPPSVPCSVICAVSEPSRTVGGDFYDFIQVDGRDQVGIVIADASGKGMPAALLISQIQAIIHSEVNNGNSISTMLKNMNSQVAASTSAEKYVTLFYGELHRTTGDFHYANAGHNYPVLVRATGEVELLETGGPVIGAFPFMDYQSTTVRLEPDDVLFFFTDGLSEALNEAGREYGEERIREFIRTNRNLTPDEIMQKILDDVRAFDPTTPPRDDTTIITLKMTPVGAEIHERQAQEFK